MPVQSLAQNQNYINYQNRGAPVDDYTRSMLQLGVQNGMGTYGYNSAIQQGGNSGLPLAMQYANRQAVGQSAYNPTGQASSATMTPQGSWQIGGANASAPAAAASYGSPAASGQMSSPGAMMGSPTQGGMAPTGSNIAGNLPFGGLANQAGMLSQDPATGYGNAYLSSLQMNQQNYGNILGGYQQTMAAQRNAQGQIAAGYPALTQSTLGYLQPMRDALGSQQAAQGQVQQGYGNLSNTIQGQSLQPMRDAQALQQKQQPGIIQGYDALQKGVGGGYDTLNSGVQAGIQGIDASQRQAIADAYAQQQGASTQSLTNRGLGNTTVADSVQRGNLFDKQKADIALSNQTAALGAGYRANIGLAGLGAQQNLGLSGLNYQGQALRDQVQQGNTIGNAQAGYQAQVGLPGLANQAQNARDNTQQSNAIAGQYANYNSQLGLAGLGYADKANQQNTGLSLDQLHWMNSVQAGYPNASQYMQLAQQRGAARQGAPPPPALAGGGGNRPPGNVAGRLGNDPRVNGAANNPAAPGGQLANNPAGLAPEVQDAINRGDPNAAGMTGNNWTGNSSWWPNSGNTSDATGGTAGSIFDPNNSWQGSGVTPNYVGADNGSTASGQDMSGGPLPYGGSDSNAALYSDPYTSGQRGYYGYGSSGTYPSAGGSIGTPRGWLNGSSGWLGNSSLGAPRNGPYSGYQQNTGTMTGNLLDTLRGAQSNATGSSAMPSDVQQTLAAATPEKQKNYADILASLPEGLRDNPSAMQWALKSAGLA